MKLLVAAVPVELVAFPEEIPGFDRVVTGPGKLKATYALTRALERGQYDEIVVVGTSGTVDPGLHGGVHEIAAAVQHDVWDGEHVVGQHVTLPARVETGREGIVVATGDHFVDTAAGVDTVRSLGGSLIDMETYAYIWVAQQYDVPIRVVRCVSDDADEGAFASWDEAAAACSAVLWDWFRAEFAI
ncbi:phosphorylase family protein [Microbacterium gorillae]|uniref:phosphorylase family protein n=1 Tax=Microbacterium gorillae TaxID=1231063 RepID=UPI00058DBBED|nr:nucleoside phosphorylase [Microbacterium gorillae]